MKKYKTIIFLFILTQTNAQTFYITSSRDSPLGNKAFLLDIENCDSVATYSCLPSNNALQYFENKYGDIAIDNNQNIYYVSGWGSLYERNLNDTISCQFVGTFNNSINALVADSTGTLYAAGNQNSVCTLYKYSSGIFTTIGNFPLGFFSSGDLFFYEHRLFLTATNSNFTASYLVEVSLPDPVKSCYYMGLENLQPYAAFSIKSLLNSKAFIISSNNYLASSLFEIDIPNHTIGNPICTYPFLIDGAASSYTITSDSTTPMCNVVTMNSTLSTSLFFIIQNPVLNSIQISTNIDPLQLANLILFDVTGKEVREYTNQNFRENLDVSDIQPGLYILQVTTRRGEVFDQKLVKIEN